MKLSSGNLLIRVGYLFSGSPKISFKPVGRGDRESAGKAFRHVLERMHSAARYLHESSGGRRFRLPVHRNLEDSV